MAVNRGVNFVPLGANWLDHSVELLEISIKPRAKHPLKLRMFDTLRKEDLSDCLHEALKFKLEDGSLFVIDLAGPQYGQYVPVMPYDTYLKKMARDKSSVTDHPFGYQRAWMVKACIPQFLEDPRYIYDTRIPKADEQLYHTFNECLKSWQSKKMPLTAMLKLKEGMYLETQKDLLTAVEKTLCDARF